MKKIFMLVLALVACLSMAVPTFAMDNGAFYAYVITDYYNPDTGNIDDGGTANAALGEGMCRSATDTRGLVEKIGDEYFVTIRLLLQSNTKEVSFYTHAGYDQYQPVNYTIMTENAMEDSVDYRFQVADPFAPIKATMYVTPMGRDVLWYIYLDESTLSSDTGDFVVTATADVIANLEQPEGIIAEEVFEETTEEVVVEEETMEAAEEEVEVEEIAEETVEVVEEATETVEIVEEETTEVVEEENTEEPTDVAEVEEVQETEEKSALPMVVGIVVALAALMLVVKKKLGGGK
ncbi:heme-binding Shp domain-containing protein [Chakrabartyella piscis]|uniref:heme-binding Shp domain-containing protein n=1 Tax=Chakrabartyella piscis TaxID=2918914 RepID=UPI002958DAEC|nr:heme-binding Shp domain-containing protein [Chakrabartyella piscis]